MPKKAWIITKLYVNDTCVFEAMVTEGAKVIYTHKGVKHKLRAGSRTDFYPSGPTTIITDCPHMRRKPIKVG